MSVCVYTEGTRGRGHCVCEGSKGLACDGSAESASKYGCSAYSVQTDLRTSVQAAMDAGVPPPARPRPFDADDLGGESEPEVGSVPDSDVPGRYPPLSCPDGGPEIRPLVFGVARPDVGPATVPVFVMVCGRTLDGECPHPCYFGMYSTDISAAYEKQPRKSTLVVPDLSRTNFPLR